MSNHQLVIPQEIRPPMPGERHSTTDFLLLKAEEKLETYDEIPHLVDLDEADDWAPSPSSDGTKWGLSGFRSMFSSSIDRQNPLDRIDPSLLKAVDMLADIPVLHSLNLSVYAS